jgi:hypothetical protein
MIEKSGIRSKFDATDRRCAKLSAEIVDIFSSEQNDYHDYMDIRYGDSPPTEFVDKPKNISNIDRSLRATLIAYSAVIIVGGTTDFYIFEALKKLSGW